MFWGYLDDLVILQANALDLLTVDVHVGSDGFLQFTQGPGRGGKAQFPQPLSDF